MRFLRLLFIILATLVLQTVVFARLNFFGVVPNLMLVLIVVLAVLEDDPVTSLLLAAVTGLAQDALASGPYINTAGLIAIATLIGVIKQSYSNDEYSFIAGLVALFTPLCLIAEASLLSYWFARPIVLPDLLLNLVLGTLYNVILVPVGLPLLRKVLR
jgi:rod shape-determining protein MreD